MTCLIQSEQFSSLTSWQ